MAEQFAGNWHLSQQDKFEDFMKAIGGPADLAKMSASMNLAFSIKVTNKTHVEIEHKWYKMDDKEFKNVVKTLVLAFDIGQGEVDEAWPWGLKVKSTFAMKDGNKILQTQKDASNGSAVLTTTYSLADGGKTLLLDIQGGGVKAVRKFTRQ